MTVYSASYVSRQRDTARSQLLLIASRAAMDAYLLAAGPTAANPPERSAAAE